MSACVQANNSLLPQAVERDSALAVIAGVDILIALWVIKFLDACGNDPGYPASPRHSKWQAELSSSRSEIPVECSR